MSSDLKIITRGHGPDLVLLHGWAMHSGVWGGVADALSKQFRIHLVDLPGHGVNRDVLLSEDLETTADVLVTKLPPAIWVGWSLGGLIALASALNRPEKTQRMVLVATAPSFIRRDDWPYGLDATILQAFSNGLEKDFAGTLKRFLVLETVGSDTARKTLRRLRDVISEEQMPAKPALTAGLKILQKSNLGSRLSGCNVPALFVGGSKDQLVHPDSPVHAAAQMPDATAKIIDGAGHVPFIGHPDRFLESLHGFLGSDKTT